MTSHDTLSLWANADRGSKTLASRYVLGNTAGITNAALIAEESFPPLVSPAAVPLIRESGCRDLRRYPNDRSRASSREWSPVLLLQETHIPQT